MCRSKGSWKKAVKNPREIRQVVEVEPDVPTAEDSDTYMLFRLSNSNSPIQVEVQIEGNNVSMELDTGAAVPVISENTYKSLKSLPPLQKSKSQAAYIFRRRSSSVWLT